MGMTFLLCALGAYLLGSIPFAVVVSRAMGLEDPREYGSGNPGATNVLRSGNKLAALLTLLGDGAKGWLAVWLARRLELGEDAVALAAIAVFLGHLFPVWLRFKGGKGVATAAGVLLALDWRLCVATLATWLAVVLVTRYSSVGALVAAVVAPIAAWHFLGIGPAFVATLAMSALLIWRHEANIRKLARGEERRIGAPKDGASPAG